MLIRSSALLSLFMSMIHSLATFDQFSRSDDAIVYNNVSFYQWSTGGERSLFRRLYSLDRAANVVHAIFPTRSTSKGKVSHYIFKLPVSTPIRRALLHLNTSDLMSDDKRRITHVGRSATAVIRAPNGTVFGQFEVDIRLQNGALVADLTSVPLASHMSIRLRPRRREISLDKLRVTSRPFLALITDSTLSMAFSLPPVVKQRRRRPDKRSVAEKRRQRKFRDYDVPCGRHDLIVDVRRLGWHRWIVHPQRFNIFTCYGSCSAAYASAPATNHAVLQGILHSRDRRHVPSPCCRPIRYRPMSALYSQNDGGYALRRHDDLVVEECGCG